MTRIVALLNFYDENPLWLHDTIVSLTMAGVDHVIAADGAYALYPEGKARSDARCELAIHEAARIAQIPLTFFGPARVWEGNELEKRTRMFRMGEEHAPDWYLIIDADERVIRCPDDLKARLSETEADMADVMSLEHEAPVVHAMAEGADWPQIHFQRHVKPRRCLIRAVPGLRVVGRHNDYITPDGRNLWGDEMGSPLRIRDMMIDHRNRLRPGERRQAAIDYVAARTATGAEPGLRATPPASDEKLKMLNGRLRRGLKNWTPA